MDIPIYTIGDKEVQCFFEEVDGKKKVEIELEIINHNTAETIDQVTWTFDHNYPLSLSWVGWLNERMEAIEDANGKGLSDFIETIKAINETDEVAGHLQGMKRVYTELYEWNKHYFNIRFFDKLNQNTKGITS
ncbi:hypothetical protein MKY91_20655 [Alkalicoccobacillus gibsonii]|uniref:Uncharacterized protein n=1 Tax=Alkalicoccobacillus gibsonii TaxID=79881 RepID=A0ABU9VNU0_9BACI